MPDIFDTIHAQAPAAPAGGGDIFDQVHAQAGGGEKSIGGFASNAVTSMGNLLGGVAAAVASPLVTAKAVGSVVFGGLDKATAAMGIPEDPKHPRISPAAFDSLVDHFKQRYGSLEGVKDALYKDPAGVAMDASVLFGGVGSAAKAANLTNVAKVARIASEVTNPVGLTVKAGVGTAKAARFAARTGVNRAVSVAGSPRPLSADALAKADELGIPLSRGDAGGSKFTQRTEHILGSTVAPDLYEAKVQAGRAGIMKGVNELTGDFATDHFAAGDNTVQRLLTHAKERESTGHGAYDALAKIEADPANAQTITKAVKTVDTGLVDESGNPITRQQPVTETVAMPVTLASAKQALTPIRDKILKQMPLAQQQQSRGLQALQNIIDGPDFVSASTADANLSALKNILREDVDGKVKFLVNKAISATSPAVDEAVAKAGPEATKALSTARAAWKERSTALDFVDELTKGASSGGGQKLAADRLLKSGDGSYPLLKKVLEVSPESAEDLGKAHLSQVFKGATDADGITRPGAALNLWNQIGPRTKSLLYKPEQIKDIDAVMELSKRLAENPNPSGTGTMNALIKMGVLISNPVSGGAALIGGRALAKMLYNPEAASAVRTVLQNPTSPAASKAVTILQNMKTAGKKLIGDNTGSVSINGKPLDYERLDRESSTDGLSVRDKIPNMGSIESTLTNYETLPGVHEIPMAELTGGAPFKMSDHFYNAAESGRVNNLASQISQSGEINPLIVVMDKDGPYILEGGHRYAALHKLGKKSFPAKVVIDRDSIPE